MHYCKMFSYYSHHPTLSQELFGTKTKQQDLLDLSILPSNISKYLQGDA